MHNLGFTAQIVRMYISDGSPARLCGLIISVDMIFISTGAVLAYIRLQLGFPARSSWLKIHDELECVAIFPARALSLHVRRNPLSIGVPQ
jgi:hypothetical protein